MGVIMNFDFIEDLTEKHDGKNSLTVTGKYTSDVLTKIITELGSGKRRTGVVMYFNNVGVDRTHFECDIFIY
jgi:hypothetical protein